MSEACHCCGGDVLQAGVACLGVLTESGLNIRIEAGHHPSSSLVHPADKLKDLRHKWENMKTGYFAAAVASLQPKD